MRVAVLLVESVEQAEDVVSDAFAAVGRRWGSLDNPGGYLRTCVVNGCRQALRRRGRERRLAESGLLVSPSVQTPEPLAESLLDLRRALGALTERQRTVVVLRYLDDRPDEEIARLLSCRPATVRSLARRALVALREELQ